MPLPPPPNVPEPPDLGPKPEGRRCAACGEALTPTGVQAFRTAGGNGRPDGVLVLDSGWCPRCGRLEFFSGH